MDLSRVPRCINELGQSIYHVIPPAHYRPCNSTGALFLWWHGISVRGQLCLYLHHLWAMHACGVTMGSQHQRKMLESSNPKRLCIFYRRLVSLTRMCCFGCQSFRITNRTSFSTAVSAASDLALAIYPVRLISKLQMPFRVKLGLAAIFALGFV